VGFLKQTFVARGCRYLTQCDCKPVWGGVLHHCGDFGEQCCRCDVDQSSGILCDKVLRRGDQSGASGAVRVAVARGVAAGGVEVVLAMLVLVLLSAASVLVAMPRSSIAGGEGTGVDNAVA